MNKAQRLLSLCEEISKSDALKAWKIVAQHQVIPQNSVIQQLVQSLLVYKDRGEFDGSFESALACWKQAEYEIGK